MNAKKFISRWEKVKYKGKKRHVLNSGIMSGIMAFIGLAGGSLIYGYSLVFHMHLVMSIGGFIGGIIGGIINWQRNEEKYNQLLNSNLNE